MTDALVFRRDLLMRLRISASTLRRWREAEKFPPPDVNINRETQAWKRSTLEAAGIKLP